VILNGQHEAYQPIFNDGKQTSASDGFGWPAEIFCPTMAALWRPTLVKKIDHQEALVASVLAVNGFGVEKVYGLLPAFRNSGLTDLNRISKKGIEEVTILLARSGYDRGLLTGMMAERLLNLITAIVDGGLDGLEEMVISNKRDKAVHLLCTVRGIGPRVAANAWILMRRNAKG